MWAVTEKRSWFASALLGCSGWRAPSLPEETFWAVRRLVKRRSDQPLVVVIEDIHWAEETLLDLIEYLVERTSEAPVLLLTLARPDIGEMRPGWGSGIANATTIELRPLGDKQADALIDNLLGVEGGGARRAMAPAGNQHGRRQSAIRRGTGPHAGR